MHRLSESADYCNRVIRPDVMIASYVFYRLNRLLFDNNDLITTCFDGVKWAYNFYIAMRNFVIKYLIYCTYVILILQDPFGYHNPSVSEGCGA